MKTTYSEEFREIMKANLKHTSMIVNRVDEILNFARGMNFKRIGIAHCITFYHEAEVLRDYFSKYFEVFMVDCKYERVTKKEMLGGEGSRVLCNPAGQANFLNQNQTKYFHGIMCWSRYDI